MIERLSAGTVDEPSDRADVSRAHQELLAARAAVADERALAGPAAEAGEQPPAGQASRRSSRYVAAASSSAVQRQKTPNPCQGVSNCPDCWWSAVI